MPDKQGLGLTTYKWDGNSIIPQIDVRNDGVAYIHASRNARNLPELRTLFVQNGWTTQSEMLDNNQPVLQVSGFKNPDDIIKLLATAGALEGTPNVSQATPENQKKRSSLRENSLRGSGIFYAIGNTLYSAYGFMTKNSGYKWIGINWNGADIIMAIFGRKDEKIESLLLTEHLYKHFQENGVPVQKDDAISIETQALHNSSGMDKTKYFVHNHVTHLKSISEVIGGGLMFLSGIKARKEKTPGSTSQIIAGTALVTGFGSAGIIREKKIDPEKYAKANPLKKLWMKVQERPLQLAAVSGVLNNIFNAISATQQYKEAKRTNQKPLFIWGIIAYASGVCSLFVANLLYFISHKTGGDIKTSTLRDDIYSKTAQVLEHLDPQAREIGIKQAAEFLGGRTEIRDTKEQVEANLRREIDELQRNPWFATDGICTTCNDKPLGPLKFQPVTAQDLAAAGNAQAMQTLQNTPGVKTTTMSPRPSLDTVSAASTPLQHTPQVTT